MDEQELSRAIDRLNAELPPGPGEPELLALARRIRGLRAPTWPDDPDAFVARLLPRRRSAWALRGLAGAAVLVLVLLLLFGSGRSGAPARTVPARLLLTLRLPASAALPAHLAQTTTPINAASEPPTRFFVWRSVAAPPTLAFELLGWRGFPSRPRLVLRRLLGGAVVDRLRPIPRGRTLSLRIPEPGSPGWYVLSLPDGERYAFFLPYPPGAVLHGRATFAGRAIRGRVTFGAVFTEVSLRLQGGLRVQSAELDTALGIEPPLRLERGPTSIRLLFGPTPLVAKDLRLRLRLIDRTVLVPLTPEDASRKTLGWGSPK